MTPTEADASRYWYRATYVSNYDGDTVDVDLDLGFRITWRVRIRLYGINAPELKAPTLEAGRAARDFLATALKDGAKTGPLYVRTHRDQADKYGGRWLGELWVPSPDPSVTGGNLVNLNALLVIAGHAVGV